MIATFRKVPNTVLRVRPKHGEAGEVHAGQSVSGVCLSGNAVPIARGEKCKCARGLGIKRLVRDAGGDQEDIAGVCSQLDTARFSPVAVRV